MSGVSPDASREEIEAEIVFYSVLFSTLDEAADDYLEKKTEYETALADLEARLEPQRGPQTPSHHQTRETPRSGTFNLPSRESKNAPTVSDVASTLQSHRGPGPYAGTTVSGEESSGTTTSSSNHPGTYPKRPRESFSVSGASKKSKRRDTSPLASGATTPMSTSSVDPEDDFLAENASLKHLTSNRAYIWKKIQEQERQREARIKMEQEDREIARALSTQSSSQDPSRSSAATQSYFQPNGDWRRPKPEPTAASSQNNRTATERILPPSQVKSEIPSVFQGSSAAAASQSGHDFHRPLNSSTHLHSRQESSDDDSDVQVISADQFTASVGGSHNRVKSNGYQLVPPPAPTPNASQPSWEDVLRPLPGHTQWTPQQQRLAIHAPSELLRSYASAGFRVQRQQQQQRYSIQPGLSNNLMAGGTPVYGQQLTSWQQAATSTVQQAGNAIWNGMASMADHLRRGIARESDEDNEDPYWYGDLGLPGPGFRREHVYSLEDDLSARGLNYMLADPTKTKEDLEALLANIRPDEDLPPEMRIGTPEQLKISLMEHQKLGLTWLQQQEEGSNKGAILADDMGLGKTIQALALILTRPSDDTACKATLIVAPVSLLNQWKREIEQKVNRHHRLSVFVMHGRNAHAKYPLLSTHDVVITTYGTIAAEYTRDLKYQLRRKHNPNAGRLPEETPVLLGERCKWHRVILDEAQMIKNKNTKSALACLQLVATYRLCMTGTPMMNNVGELYSLIRFLRISPYNDQNRFNREIKKPIEGRYEAQKQRAMKQLQGLLKAVLLRRTKTSEIDGKPILQLPERSTEVVHAVFDEDQLGFYKAIEDQAILQVSKYLEAGKIGRNYSYILVRLLRLRQACCHPLMIQDFAQDGPGDVTQEEMEQLVKSLSDEVVERIKESNGQFECPICYDAVENPTIFFPCGHDSCIECFAKITDPSRAVAAGEERSVARCPECRSRLDDKKVFDYKAFKKVHLAEDEGSNDAEEDVLDDESDDDDDGDEESANSEADESEDEISDADSQGDLRDFIVPDDVSVDEENDEEEQLADGEDGESDTKVKIPKAAGGPRKRKAKKIKQSKTSKGKEKKRNDTKKLAELRKEGLKSAKAKKKYLRHLRKKWVTSAKVDKAREILQNIHEKDPSEKIIVFSQFSSFLDLLEVPIGDDGWRYCRYDGSMSAKDRNAAVEAFQDKSEIKLMLVSLKAGNAGLNLTAASQVIIMDPFWNPFIEEQAVDRAHRIGQTRPVVVHRVLIEDTVEDRIIALQEKKRALINEALDEKAGQSLSRLGVRELRYLFGISNNLPS